MRLNAERAGWPVMSDLMLAPMVACMRLPAMIAEAQYPGMPGKETVKAVSEKIAAATEGIAAAQLSLMASLAGFWPEVASGRIPAIANGVAIERSLNAALRPAGRRVRANFKRLAAKS